MMKALSIKQPWAWLICAGYKDIENRTWKIGRNSRHGPYSSYDQANFTIKLPCRIYVHAGKQMDDKWPTAGAYVLLKENHGEEAAKDFYERYFALGAIVGEVDITGCVTESKSPWFVGPYGFTLANPVLYEKPIPCRGALGFFEPRIQELPA